MIPVEFSSYILKSATKGTTVRGNYKDSRDRPVSIIIVNFNGGPLLHEAVGAALSSSIPVEILISDNGSTDGSLNAVYQTFGKDRRVHIISNGSNLGFSRANNIALKKAQGDYVLLLNPDCIINTNTLARMLDVMDSNPDAGMAGCLIRNPDGTEQPGCRRAVPTPWRTFVRVLHLNRLFPNNPRFRTFLLHQEPLPSDPDSVEAISGAFMLVRREALEQVGLLDASYFMHCEDIDWCMRFRQAGWKIVFVPNVEVLHYKGACSKDHPIRVLYHMHRGMIRFYRKFFRRQYPLPLMAIVISTVWARFIALAAKEFLKRPFRKHLTGEPGPTLPFMRERRNPATVVAYIGPERRIHNQDISWKLYKRSSGRLENSSHERI
jgi:GT2 family glycosyltransferase